MEPRITAIVWGRWLVQTIYSHLNLLLNSLSMGEFKHMLPPNYTLLPFTNDQKDPKHRAKTYFTHLLNAHQ